MLLKILERPVLVKVRFADFRAALRAVLGLRRGGEEAELRRQYLYFCTSKAN